jgi:hypothetical protein
MKAVAQGWVSLLQRPEGCKEHRALYEEPTRFDRTGRSPSGVAIIPVIKFSLGRMRYEFDRVYFQTEANPNRGKTLFFIQGVQLM